MVSWLDLLIHIFFHNDKKLSNVLDTTKKFCSYSAIPKETGYLQVSDEHNNQASIWCIVLSKLHYLMCLPPRTHRDPNYIRKASAGQAKRSSYPQHLMLNM